MTQTEKILALLKANGRASNYELNETVCMRYGARIHELRKQGHRIRTEHDKTDDTKWWFVLEQDKELVENATQIDSRAISVEKNGILEAGIERTFKNDFFLISERIL